MSLHTFHSIKLSDHYFREIVFCYILTLKSENLVCILIYAKMITKANCSFYLKESQYLCILFTTLSDHYFTDIVFLNISKLKFPHNVQYCGLQFLSGNVTLFFHCFKVI